MAAGADAKMVGNDNDRDQSGKRLLDDESDPLADRTSDDAVAKAAIDVIRNTPTADLGNATKDTIKTPAKQHKKK